jgi:uncharacterized membrane protein YeaQ/YmgE (transglycosylase-associated protein family)
VIAVNYLVITLIWIGCVIVGAVVGFLAGYVLWKLGFEVIGSAVAVVGACIGGFIVLAGLASWSNNRRK